MAFTFKGRWAVFLVIAIVVAGVLAFFLTGSRKSSIETDKEVPQINTTGATDQTGPQQTNGTRFVDTITKLRDTDRNIVEKELSGFSRTNVSVDVDTRENMEALLPSFSPAELELIYKSSYSPGFDAWVTKEGLYKLQSNEHVVSISYNHPTVPLLQDSTSIINATIAWNLKIEAANLTGRNVTICIVDTGVNYTHPDLGNCSRTSNISSAGCPKVIGGRDILGNDSDPMDENGHGTHVAGIAAANGTIKGVAPNSQLVAVRAVGGSKFQLEDGIQWCINNRNSFNPPIKIISLSGAIDAVTLYNGTCDGVDVVVNASNNASAYGLMMIAASGNNASSTSMLSPACGSNVTSVGATTKLDLISTAYSNRNNLTDLLAPGIVINSTNWNTSGYIEESGTSQAAPHVAGAAALLLQLKPDLTPNQIKEVLNITGKSIADSASGLTFSRIDVLKAIMALNASLLQAHSLSEAYSNDTYKIFSFSVRNANLTNITNISWQVIVENGTTVNSTSNFSLTHSKSVFVLFEHNFSKPGIYEFNASAASGNLFHVSNLTVHAGDLLVTTLDDVDTNETRKTWRVTIGNNKTAPITGVNWSFDFDDGEVSYAQKLTNLSVGEKLFLLVQRTYANPGNWIVNVTAFTGSKIHSRIRRLSYLNVSGLRVVNSSLTKKIFGFNLTNHYFINLTGILWNFTFGDNSSLNVTQALTLAPNETAFAVTERTYSGSGTYQANASAKNGTLLSSQNITVSVS